MNFDCPQCSQQLVLGESPPPGQTATLRCGRCQQPIIVVGHGSTPDSRPLPAQASGSTSDIGTVLLEALRTAGAAPVAGTGRLGTGIRRVLLCFGNTKLRAEVLAGFDKQRNEVRTMEDVLSAVRAIRDTSVDLLILDPLFEMEEKGHAKMMEYLGELSPRVRRKLFVVLVSPQYKSLDRSAAFAEQVNLVLNPRNASTFQQLIDRGLRDYEEFYKTFHEISARVS